MPILYKDYSSNDNTSLHANFFLQGEASTGDFSEYVIFKCAATGLTTKLKEITYLAYGIGDFSVLLTFSGAQAHPGIYLPKNTSGEFHWGNIPFRNSNTASSGDLLLTTFGLTTKKDLGFIYLTGSKS